MGRYIRKTVDEYHIQGNYGYGWETECTEDTRKEARQQLRCYRENGPGAYRMVKRRVKIARAEGRD